ncbi:MAG: hypothetical protein ACKVQC_04040 [Elusimicrobiota bacterium]
MDSIQGFRERLAALDTMLNTMKSSHVRIQQLKRSVYVLKSLLREEKGIQSPYGPETPIAKFSLQ